MLDRANDPAASPQADADTKARPVEFRGAGFVPSAGRYSGWLEMGGSGMVDPKVFENVGVDPEEWSGFAFGCGIERVAQLKFDFPDIRALWEGDLRVLRQF